MEVQLSCPCCNKNFLVINDTTEIKNATVDCPGCKKLLLVLNNVPYDFHKKIHEMNPRWPESGEGTGFIKI